jgi:hypothetical protein
MTVTVPTVAVDFWFRGVPDFTANRISIRVAAFRQAVRWKMLPDDPCAGVDLPPVKRLEMQALSVEECRQFLEAARGSEWFSLFALAPDYRNAPE